MLRLVERILADRTPAAVVRALRGGERLVLAYHNVVPDDGAMVGERSLHLPLARFREQLDALQDACEVGDLAALLASPEATGRPRIAITFDDAYRGCLEIALPELVRRGLPATVFVSPGLVDGEGCWWDRLADPATGLLDAGVRAHVLGALAGDGDAALAWARARGLRVRDCPPVARIASLGEIQSAAALPGIRIGAHSWTHRALPQVPDAERSRELEGALAWLRERIPGTMAWLAFPYGLHDAAVADRALSSGYEAVLRIFGGWMRPRDDVSRSLPRLNIPASVRTARFMLLTRGLFPLQ